MSITGRIIFGTYVNERMLNTFTQLNKSFSDIEEEIETFGFTWFDDTTCYLGKTLLDFDDATLVNVAELYNRAIDLPIEERCDVIKSFEAVPEDLKVQLPPVWFYVIGEMMDVIIANESKKIKRSVRAPVLKPLSLPPSIRPVLSDPDVGKFVRSITPPPASIPISVQF